MYSNSKLSPPTLSSASKTPGRQCSCCHISLAGICLAVVAVAFVSFADVMTEMRGLGGLGLKDELGSHAPSSGTLKEDYSIDASGRTGELSDDLHNYRSHDSVDASVRNGALSGEDGDSNDRMSPHTFTADRINYNKQNKQHSPSQSMKQRQNSYPRIISFEGDKTWVNNLRGKSSSDEEHTRTVEVSKEAINRQKHLENSKDFRYRDPLYEGECVPMQEWQETSFPNCNTIHEMDFAGKTRTEEFEYYAKGGYNQIFWINELDKDEDPELIMKILKYGTEYTDRNFDRVRRDGLILERLKKSPYVLDTYGFCGFDVLTPYASEGTLSGRLSSWRRGKEKLSQKTRLRYAMEVSLGLAAVHDIDGDGLSSVAHGDLKGGQYLFMDGTIQLGDFNRGRFLRRNSTAPDTACTYTIGKNDAAFRSPEEYEYLPQTSAIDVYALGSILFQILTGKEVWYDEDTKKAQKLIRKGKLPKMDDKIKNSTEPFHVALKKAVDLCYVFDPKKRATAAEVASHLQKAYSKFSDDGQ